MTSVEGSNPYRRPDDHSEAVFRAAFVDGERQPARRVHQRDRISLGDVTECGAEMNGQSVVAEGELKPLRAKAEFLQRLPGDVYTKRSEPVGLKDLAHDQIAFDPTRTEWSGLECGRVESLTYRVRLHAARERSGSRREDVARVKGSERAAKVDLRGVDHNPEVETAGTLHRRKQHAVIRTNELRAVLSHETQIAPSGSHAGIDDDEMDRLGQLVDAGGGRRRTLADIERRDVVPEVDHSCVRAGTYDDRVAHSHPGIIEPKVRDEGDNGLHGALQVFESTRLLCPRTRWEGNLSRSHNWTAAVIVLAAVLLAGCTSFAPDYVNAAARYDSATATALLGKVSTAAVRDRALANAKDLRHDALSSLRRKGDEAAAAATLITKTFPSDTNGVPVYVERASYNGKPAWVIVEAVAAGGDKLGGKRLWVIGDDGSVLLSATR